MHIKTLSHVGIYPADFEKSLQWYREVMGLDEAFRLYDKQGNLIIVYLHLGPQTFIEIFNKPPDTPHKTHFSVEVEQIEQAVAELMTRLPPASVMDTESRQGMDGSKLFNFCDLDGNRIELQELPPDSLQEKARTKRK